MYKEIVETSKQLIKQSYSNLKSPTDKTSNSAVSNDVDSNDVGSNDIESNNSPNDNLVTKLHSYSKILLEEKKFKDAKVAISFYGFFLKLKTFDKTDYISRINLLGEVRNMEVSKILVTEYWEAISNYFASAKRHSVDLSYSIMPKNLNTFLNDLYLHAAVNDNLDLFSWLSKDVIKLNPEQLLTQFEQALKVSSDKIVNYLLVHVNQKKFFNIFKDPNINGFLHLEHQTKKNIIEKFYLKQIDNKQKQKKEPQVERITKTFKNNQIKMFLKIAETEFNNENKELMTMLLKAGVDINCTDDNGATPLQIAAFRLSIDHINYFIEKKATINFKQLNRGNTALNLAINSNQPDILTRVNVLIKARADVEALNSKGLTPLIQAILQNNIDLVKLLLESKADINNNGKSGLTPLHVAAQCSSLKMMEYLISKKPNLEAFDKEGNTVLHNVAGIGTIKYMELLINNDLDIDVKNEKDNTPLHFAITHNKIDNIKYLVEKGADLTAKTKEGNTAFLLAAINSSQEILELLENKGADINATDSKSKNALHLATVLKRNDNIEPLLNLGIDVESKSNEGYTAVQWAVWSNNIAGFILLVAKKANTKVTDVLGQNLIHWAVIKKHIEFIKILVELKVDINARLLDKTSTPLEMAIGFGDIDIVKELIKYKASFNPNLQSTKNLVQKAPDAIKKILNSLISKQQKEIESPKKIESETNSNSNSKTTHYSPVETASEPNISSRKSNTYESKSTTNKRRTTHNNVKKTTKMGSSSSSKERDTNASQPSTAVNKNSIRINTQQSQQANLTEISTFLVEEKRKERATVRQKAEKSLTKQKESKGVETTTENRAAISEVGKADCYLEANVSLLSLTPSNLQDYKVWEKTNDEIAKMRELILKHFSTRVISLLHREDWLDHELGRPAIIINKINDNYAILLGSSHPPSNSIKQKYFALTLSKEDDKTTYFYDIIYVQGKKQIKGPWNTDVKLTNEHKTQIVNLISCENLFKLCKNMKSNIKDIVKKTDSKKPSNSIEKDSTSLIDSLVTTPIKAKELNSTNVIRLEDKTDFVDDSVAVL